MERRFGWLIKAFGEMVGLFETKTRASFTVIMIACIIWLLVENKGLNDRLFNESRRNADSETAIYQRIIDRYDPAFREIKEATDSSRAKVDSTTSLIQPVLRKLMNKLEGGKK
ncbi:hypothetical protein ACR777_15090 [Sphingobacterium spiritivorum]|uniref:hypothetical protein n=1 Tax=Sphingobacterium spiritivorum TaxID=258 RepID=UPI003DA667EC